MSQRYWDPQLETLPTERRRLLRDHRLRWQVRRCWDGSPFYRARLAAAGIDPSTFGGLADVARLPVLRAHEDLAIEAEDNPDESWSVAPRAWWSKVSHDAARIARALTDGDIVHQVDLTARALWSAGARAAGTVSVSGIGEGDEVANLVVLASARIGMTVNNVSYEAGLPLGERLRATIGVTDREPAELVWRFVWPPVPEQTGPDQAALILWYVAPTVAYTCAEANGIHWSDDHYFIEILDQATGSPVTNGQAGALVVTDLTREGSPLLRFWTGLEATLIEEPCPCGRTSARSPFVRPLV